MPLLIFTLSTHGHCFAFGRNYTQCKLTDGNTSKDDAHSMQSPIRSVNLAICEISKFCFNTNQWERQFFSLIVSRIFTNIKDIFCEISKFCFNTNQWEGSFSASLSVEYSQISKISEIYLLFGQCSSAVELFGFNFLLDGSLYWQQS